jgi:collagenase-like PrtC family protease
MATTTRLDVPVRSLEMLDLQLRARADEIYLGMLCEPLRVLTFNALARTRDEQPTQVESPKLLGQIVTRAHAGGMTVNFSANLAYLPAAFHPAYVDHVRQALDLGVDRVVVANLGLMRLLRTAGITAPLVAAGYMGVGTARLAAYLRDTLGVTRIILPHAMAFEEVARFTQLPGLEIEIPAQTGAGNTCGRCMMFDSPTFPEIGLGCRAGYRVRTPEGTVLEESRFLDGGTDCSLCSVPELMQIGVHVLKIAGRESPNVRQNAKVTQFYRKAIDNQLKGKDIEATIRQIAWVELMWTMGWVPRLCDQKRCRFLPTPTNQAYV